MSTLSPSKPSTLNGTNGQHAGGSRGSIIPRYHVPGHSAGFNGHGNVGKILQRVVESTKARFELAGLVGTMTCTFGRENSHPLGNKSGFRALTITDDKRSVICKVNVEANKARVSTLVFARLDETPPEQVLLALKRLEESEDVEEGTVGMALSAALAAQNPPAPPPAKAPAKAPTPAAKAPSPPEPAPSPELPKVAGKDLKGFTDDETKVGLLILELIEQTGRNGLRDKHREITAAVKLGLERMYPGEEILVHSASMIGVWLRKHEYLRPATYSSHAEWSRSGEPYVISEKARQLAGPPAAEPPKRKTLEKAPSSAPPAPPAAPLPTPTPPTPAPPPPAPPGADDKMAKIREKISLFEGAEARMQEIDRLVVAAEQQIVALKEEKTRLQEIVDNPLLKSLVELTK